MTTPRPVTRAVRTTGPFSIRRLLAASGAASIIGAGVHQFGGWRDTRDRLFDLELEVELAQIRERLEAARMREFRHDLVNAFSAVEGAALLVVRESLSPSDHATLVEVLQSGLNNMRRLLVTRPDEAGAGLAEIISPVVREPTWRERVTVDVAPDVAIAASPSESAEALRQLLTYANRRAPSGPIAVRALCRGGRVELWVDDRGPSLTRRQRREIGEPGRRRRLGSHQISEIRIATRLVREQGGDLRVESRPDGGESFGFSWPERGG